MCKQLLILISGLLIISCSTNHDRQKELNNRDSIASIDTLIIGERTKGLTTVYDSINGKPLFTLYDNVLVACSEESMGWYRILIYADYSVEEYERGDKLKADRKIISGNEEIGSLLTEISPLRTTDGKSAWLIFEGAIPMKYIKPETIIESAFKEYAKKTSSRAINDYKEFIMDFRLDSTEQFSPYKFFYNYESGIDDPSPLFRFGLVFDKDSLMAVVHSRPLVIDDKIDMILDRGFSCLIFSDSVRCNRFAKSFNSLIRQAD